MVYHKEKFYLMDVNSYKVDFLCKINMEDPRRWMCFCSIGERLSHISAYCGIEVTEGVLVVYNRGIYLIDCKSKIVKREISFGPSDMRRPLNLFRIQGITNIEDGIILPEYSNNKDRKEMSLYRRNADGMWKCVYTFCAGTVRHIHAVIPDQYRNRVIILTGDNDDECAIWETKDDFKHVNKVIGSKQKYRSCCGMAYPEGIVYITDSPYEQNYIYYLDESEGNIRAIPIMEIEGPVVNSTIYQKELVFSTTVECIESPKLKYLTYKRGAGVLDNYVHLYKGTLKAGFKELLHLKKDLYPMPAFNHASIILPNGECNNKLFYMPSATKGNQKLNVYMFNN